MTSLSNITRNDTTITNVADNKPSFVTWDNSSPKTWDNIGGTWDSPGLLLVNDTRHDTTMTNTPRN